MVLALSVVLSFAPFCYQALAAVPSVVRSHLRAKDYHTGVLEPVQDDYQGSVATQFRSAIPRSVMPVFTVLYGNKASSVEVARTRSEFWRASTSRDPRDTHSASGSGPGSWTRRRVFLIAGLACVGVAGVFVLGILFAWCARVHSATRFAEKVLKTAEDGDVDGFVLPISEPELCSMDRKDSVPWGHPHSSLK